MQNNQMIHFCQVWPDGYNDNRYWIGVTLGNVQHAGKPLLLGRECKTLDDVELVGAQIKVELEKVLAEARLKLGAKCDSKC